MAFATVAGMPVSVGLYTACFAMLIYALLGTSTVLSVSSTTTIAILTGAQLSASVPGGTPDQKVTTLASLTILVGGVLLLASVLRLGFLADFISAPVLTGFKAGIGVVIISDQVPKLLGLHIEKEGFFRDIWQLGQQLPHTSTLTVLVATGTLLTLILLERLWPSAPAPLVAVALSITASWYWQLEKLGVSIVGHVPQGLPSLTPPAPDLFASLVPGALGIALMSFTESIAAARAFAQPHDPPLQADKELVALGLANIGSSFLSAMPSGGGASQTAVVRGAGAVSRGASLATASAALATMLVLAPLLGLLPNATLSAVVIVYSVGLISIPEFKAIHRVRGMEFGWAVAACLGVLLFGTLQGIVVAIVVSLVGLSSQAARPPVYIIGRKPGADVLRPISPEHPDDQTFEGLLILRPEGRLFFANAQYVGERIRALTAENHPRVLVLDMGRVHDLEYSAIKMLVESDSRLTEQGIEVWVAGCNPGVLELVRRSELAERLADRMIINTRVAIERFQSRERESAPNGST